MGKHVNSEHKANKQMFFRHHNYCDFCGLVFRYKADDLARHIKEDHKLTSGNCTCSCPCCHHRFFQLKAMKKHLILEHSLTPSRPPPSKQPGYEKKLICDICGKSLQSKLQLWDHKMVKHGVEPDEMEEFKKKYKILKCEKSEECGGFGALLSNSLREHMMKKHGAERRSTCEQCGKGLSSYKQLWRHLQIHKNKGKRPFQCEICGNSVKQKLMNNFKI